MKIKRTKVSNISDAMVYSGIPMMENVDKINQIESIDITERDIERSFKLADTPVGSGHNSYLKLITVNALVTAPQYWWLQFGRYHFADIGSSQSKMHRLFKMDLDRQCNKYVHDTVIDYLEILIELFNEYKISIDELLSNVPMGLELAAAITTNYLQLKSIYNQRKNHRSKEWKTFCNWIESLPFSSLIVPELYEEEV